MFIIIHKSGGMLLLPELTSDDFKAADAGLLEVIDVSTANIPLQYFDEGWTNIDGPMSKEG